MTKPIAIILGEPNSISSEIIFKAWLKKKNLNTILVWLLEITIFYADI